MKQQIKHRFTGEVLFECDVPDAVASRIAMRYVLELAVKANADLRRANLRGHDLSGCDLRGLDLRGSDLVNCKLIDANLIDANLIGCELRDADFSNSDLSGANFFRAKGKKLPVATPAQAIENIDKVREIILDDESRLSMETWHAQESWREQTCAEEAVCGTTHCLAGWLQVCTTDPALKNLQPQIAGILAAPVASKMFYCDAWEVFEWLRNRNYVEESVKRNEVAA